MDVTVSFANQCVAPYRYRSYYDYCTAYTTGKYTMNIIAVPLYFLFLPTTVPKFI